MNDSTGDIDVADFDSSGSQGGVGIWFRPAAGMGERDCASSVLNPKIGLTPSRPHVRRAEVVPGSERNSDACSRDPTI